MKTYRGLCLSLMASLMSAVICQTPCGEPVEEGQDAFLTCEFDTGDWCHDNDVTWWVKPTRDSKNNCIMGPGCRKAKKHYVGFISSTMVEAHSGQSTLKIPKVSRSSNAYGESSSWFCQICSRMVPVCSKLEIYVKPKDVACKTRRITDENKVVKFVEIQCSTPHVYPHARCDFTQILKHGEMRVTATPNYTHSYTLHLEDRRSDYCSSQCSLRLPLGQQQEEDIVFQVAMYPDVTHGEKYSVLLRVEDKAPENSTQPIKASNFKIEATEREMRKYRTAFIVVLLVSMIITLTLVIILILLLKGRISINKRSTQGNSLQTRFQVSPPSDERALSDHDRQAEVSGVYEQYQYVDPSGYVDVNSQGAKAFPVPTRGYVDTNATREEPKYDLPQLKDMESTNFYHQL